MSHVGAVAWWRRRPRAVVSAAAGGAVAGLVALTLVLPGVPAAHHRTSVQLGTRAPTATAPSSAPTGAGSGPPASGPGGLSAPTGSPATAPAVAPTTSVLPTAAPTAGAVTPPPGTSVAAPPSPAQAPTLSGRVVTAGGAPVPDAYLIGLDTLAVSRTGADGSFTIPCPGEPLAASTWLLPVIAPGNHPTGYVKGRDTTDYPPVPGAEDAGYVFSGGASVATASVPACTGTPLTLTLPPTATVTVRFSGTGPGGYADTLELPALDPQAARDTAPVAGAQQTLSGLAAGTLTISGDTQALSCSGPGVSPDPVALGATVAVTSGEQVTVSCRI
jgi:hypothetical protein